MKNKYPYNLLGVLAITSLIPSATGFCHLNQNQLETSIWMSFMARSEFPPRDQTEIVRSLKTQLGELSGIFRAFQRRFVSKIYQ